MISTISSEGPIEQIETSIRLWRLLDANRDWRIHWSAGVDGSFYQITLRDAENNWFCVSGELPDDEKAKYDREFDKRAEAHRKAMAA